MVSSLCSVKWCVVKLIEKRRLDIKTLLTPLVAEVGTQQQSVAKKFNILQLDQISGCLVAGKRSHWSISATITTSYHHYLPSSVDLTKTTKTIEALSHCTEKYPHPKLSNWQRQTVLQKQWLPLWSPSLFCHQKVCVCVRFSSTTPANRTPNRARTTPAAQQCAPSIGRCLIK